MTRSAAALVLVCSLLWQAAAHAETLTVKLSGLSAKGGVARVLIWKEAAGFPTKFEKAVAQKSVPVTGPEAELTFTGLGRGTYAVAGYQDENGNGKMDRSLLGWPVEPTAASNGARGTMGPPSFSSAAFDLDRPAQTILLNFK